MTVQKLNMVTTILVSFLILMSCECRSQNSTSDYYFQSAGFAGTWKLLSRIDKDTNNTLINEPTLGSDPISLLIYDTLGNVSVQLMRRNRKNSIIEIRGKSSNNSNAVNGYDAYFGTFQIDTAKKEVIHTIEGSINPEDVGKQLHRNFVLAVDTLRLSFETFNQGTPVTRTLTFVRQKTAANKQNNGAGR